MFTLNDICSLAYVNCTRARTVKHKANCIRTKRGRGHSILNPGNSTDFYTSSQGDLLVNVICNRRTMSTWSQLHVRIYYIYRSEGFTASF